VNEGKENIPEQRYNIQSSAHGFLSSAYFHRQIYTQENEKNKVLVTCCKSCIYKAILCACIAFIIEQAHKIGAFAARLSVFYNRVWDCIDLVMNVRYKLTYL